MTAVVSTAALALTLTSPSPGARETELDCIVECRHAPADDVVSLTLRAADGGELPFWTPGAHIDLPLGAEQVAAGDGRSRHRLSQC